MLHRSAIRRCFKLSMAANERSAEQDDFGVRLVGKREYDQNVKYLRTRALYSLDDFKFEQDKHRLLQALIEGKINEELKAECKRFSSLLVLNWVGLLFDNKLLNGEFLARFGREVSNQTSANYSTFYKIILFQLLLHAHEYDKPSWDKLQSIWPSNLERITILGGKYDMHYRLAELLSKEGLTVSCFKYEMISSFFVPLIIETEGKKIGIFLEDDTVKTQKTFNTKWYNTLTYSLTAHHLQSRDTILCKFTSSHTDNTDLLLKLASSIKNTVRNSSKH